VKYQNSELQNGKSAIDHLAEPAALTTAFHLGGICSKMLRVVTAIAAVSLLCGCSRQKTVGPDDLRSDLTAAISLASETETFIDYVGQQRATSNFAEGHLAYLAETARQSAKELHESTPVHSIVPQFADAQKQLDALAYQLATMRYQLAEGQSTKIPITYLSTIRHRLQQIKASL
jgi:hypothetical protein